MLKKIILSAFIFLLIHPVSAKKVKFAVDMGTHTISPMGIHVMGNFQVAAGYSLNFDPATILMTQVPATSIYTAIVTIPAFQVYEFKFVNGDQSYEVEFVPEQARVGYNFNDNRWMYVDSLANDTSFIGAVKFSENSPAGKTLLRYVVDMQWAVPIPTTGVHVGSTYQGNNPATHRMANLDGSKYEIIAYINNGTQSFKYYNGNNVGTSETVPMGCATAGMRTHNLIKDTILVPVCFSGCSACPLNIKENNVKYSSLDLSPNPASGKVIISDPGSAQRLVIVDISGKIIREAVLEQNSFERKIEIDLNGLSKGLYQVYLGDGNNFRHSKLMVE